MALSWIGAPDPVVAQPSIERLGNKKQHFELLRMWRLIDELEIDEEQAMKVFPAFRRHHVERDSLSKRNRALLAVISRQLKEEAPESDLQVSIRKVRDLRAAMAKQQQLMAEDLSELLTTQQQARLLLFESTFRTDLVDIVRRVRGTDAEGPPGMEGRPERGGGRGRLWGQ
jgi:G:T/U-mismatch repair DNA glycosylase